MTKSQVRHSTVINTDVNTQGKYVTDASQIQILCFMFLLKDDINIKRQRIPRNSQFLFTIELLLY